jgi:hypothetical protein
LMCDLAIAREGGHHLLGVAEALAQLCQGFTK